MRPTSSLAVQSDPHVSLEGIRPSQAKADLRQSDSVRLPEHAGPTLGEVALEALISHYGTLKVLTIEAGETDPSFVKREILAGKFNRIAKCGPAAFAAIGAATQEAFGSLESPSSRARRVLRQAIRLLSEVEQFIDYTEDKKAGAA